MSRKICLKFLGSLARHFGEELCIDLDVCTTLRDLIVRLAFEKKAPINSEYVLFSSEGKYLDPNEDVCKLSLDRLTIHYVHPGG